MDYQPILAPAIEAAIVGQQAILTSSLLSRFRRGAGAGVYLLAAILGSCCVMMLVNLLGGGADGRFGTLNLLLELLLPAEIYLYVSHSGSSARPLTRTSGLHALPAILGTLAWETRLAPSMDGYALMCWFGYLGAAGVVARRDAKSFGSRPRLTFAITLLGSFATIAVLRLLMTFQVSTAPSFRGGLTYVLLLAVALSMTSTMLLTALRDPDVLDSPNGKSRHAASTASESDLDELGARLTTLLEAEKPYLDPALTLAALSTRLGVQERHLSQLINSRFEMNFSAYMNHRRVLAAAWSLKAHPDATATTIKSVMYESGFRSKSAFNREFRRHFGMSPSDYRAASAPPSGPSERATTPTLGPASPKASG